MNDINPYQAMAVKLRDYNLPLLADYVEKRLDDPGILYKCAQLILRRTPKNKYQDIKSELEFIGAL